jgi:threonine/homoserine/homoserine lactone efflux protein
MISILVEKAGSTMDIAIPDAARLELFVVAASVLLLIPGPAVLYIVGRSVEQGRRAGLVSVLGIHAATLVHILAAVAGLSAVLASSALAFSAVKYAGAAYLIWLGMRKLLGPTGVAEGNAVLPIDGHRRLFRDGFVVNLLNPKTAIFFLAFLPQFVDLSRGHAPTQIAFLGLTFMTLGLVSDCCYALLAGAAGGWLKRSRAWARCERYVSGLLMIGLGMTAAFAGAEKK